MNVRFRPPAPAGPLDTAAPAGPMTSPAGQACCCVARAVVRVIMPPAAGRPDETELLLCGHHYRPRVPLSPRRTPRWRNFAQARRRRGPGSTTTAGPRRSPPPRG